MQKMLYGLEDHLGYRAALAKGRATDTAMAHSERLGRLGGRQGRQPSAT